jgi:hypothetical protein
MYLYRLSKGEASSCFSRFVEHSLEARSYIVIENIIVWWLNWNSISSKKGDNYSDKKKTATGIDCIIF